MRSRFTGCARLANLRAVSDEPAPPGEPAEPEPTPPRLIIVLDALDREALAEFWSAALRYRRVGTLEQYEILEPPTGQHGPPLLIQGVGESRATKNRMHLDLHVPDAEAEASRLVALGAVRLGENGLGEIHWITMADPEGNEFDVARD